MEKFDAAFLAGIQKANDLDIHERHTLKVHRDGRLLAIELHLQFFEMLRLQSAAEADDRLVPVGGFFNPQCHRRYLLSEW